MLYVVLDGLCRLLHLCRYACRDVFQDAWLRALLLLVHSAEEFLHLHLTLQLHHAIEYGFRAWWASGDVDIDREELVNASDDMVALLERSA